VRLPAGTRDWLPDELRRKRAVEDALRALFERRHYDEVQTPNFERFDVLVSGLGAETAAATFLFQDRRGTQLALRPEMTTPIARLVSSRMRELPLPLRLSYLQPAFRYDEPQEGRMREFTMAGLELIGADGLDADAESLFSALEALSAVGLGDALFDINHAAIVDGVLDGLALDPSLAARCKRAIAARNLVGLRTALQHGGREDAAATLLELATLRGGREVLAAARAACSSPGGIAGIERLEGILARAEELGHAARLNVDLSLLRDFSYYTGFVFEGFVREVGFSLCGGGRYDDLLPRFGFGAGAVGWSLAVERLLIALERRGAPA
jgi:ATP phosphoribosyltransferase regulatory subunit